MFDSMTPQKRMIVATVISLVFFVGYTLLFAPVPQPNTVSTQPDVSASIQPAPQVGSANAPVSTAAVKAPNVVGPTDAIITTITSDEFIISVDALGRIASKKLLDACYLEEGCDSLEIVNQTQLPKPLEIRFEDVTLNTQAFSTPYTASISQATITKDAPVKVVLTQELTDLTVTKIITFHTNGHYDLEMVLSQDKRYFIAPGFQPNINLDGFTLHGVLVETNKEIITIIEDGEAQGVKHFQNVRIASSFDRYYATIFFSPKDDMNLVVSTSPDGEENPVIFVEGTPSLSLLGYIGAKEYDRLKAVDPMLLDSLEYGWFTFIAAPMFVLLHWLHGLVGNWGWAIVLVTILTRIVLYPLSYKGMVSMQKLKQIAPLIKELQTKHKGDPQKLNAAMMALYKKHGANPMGGCLPLILQIPIFFSIYRVLLNSIELQGAPWILWIDDLAKMDPYFILPLLMGATMYYQQKITPTNFTDPMQEKIFKYLPIVFTLFFFTFPAGLVLYWAVNNVLTIAQQYIVNAKFEAAAHKAPVEKVS